MDYISKNAFFFSWLTFPYKFSIKCFYHATLVYISAFSKYLILHENKNRQIYSNAYFDVSGCLGKTKVKFLKDLQEYLMSKADSVDR